MIVEPFSRKEFSEVLRRQMLPRAESGTALLVPAHPLLAARVARVVPRAAPLLRTTRQARAFVAAHWVAEGLSAKRYPTFVWVAEGEADYRLGVTRSMAARDKKLSPKNGIYIVTLPTNSFLLVPPDVPVSDGTCPHWERPHLQDAHSRLYHLYVHPSGISLHACVTRGKEHVSSRSLFLTETRLLPLAEALLEEVQNPDVQSERLARYYLATFLLHIERALAGRTVPEEDVPLRPHRVASKDAAVQRAYHYIEANLSQKITLREIAAAAYVSPSHLNRLFRADRGQTVGEYLTQRRMEHARSLLETTDLPMRRIGVLCGYRHAEQFSRAFALHHDVSPGVFRQRSRAC
jgi:AraC-like DNA-binding protein